MKKFFYVAVMALAFAACANKETKEIVATDVVPAAATEVIPVAVPGPENTGDVATSVATEGIPAK
ncbi:MAG: hypothetical protein IJY44_06685 [Bacteroidaceae bacterium]|nr:hypothetical protein [Bacteroidaceae bacterium]